MPLHCVVDRRTAEVAIGEDLHVTDLVLGDVVLHAEHHAVDESAVENLDDQR
ncbi:MAG: hypothetical protein ACI9MC_003933 [Kiritimatiellia bacterium]